MLKDLNPSCSFKHCRSFFQLNFQNMKWSKSQLPVLTSSQAISDQVKLVTKNGNVKIKQLTSIENFLYYQTTNDECKWIDIENAIIEQFQNHKFGQGIRLIKCFDIIEIFCDTQYWFKHLKRYTIQSDFNANYSLQKKIGKGKWSEVYKAKCKHDNHEYAVKIYQKNDIEAEPLLKQILVLRKIQSEFCVKFYELFESENEIYLIQELLIGQTLMDYIIKQNFFTEEQAAKIIYRLIKAVNYIHSKGIIHRDLKPDNIIFRFIEDIDTLCIKSFQIADFYNNENNYLYQKCGTPGYIAPEVLRDQNYDYKIDVYAIGIILYIIMIGQVPFDGNYQERINKNREAIIHFNNISLSYQGMNFIQKTLEADPENRYSAQECLNHEWFAQLQQKRIVTMKKSLHLPTVIQRRTKQAKTVTLSPLTFSTSSPRSQISIKSPLNHDKTKSHFQFHQIYNSKTEKLITNIPEDIPHFDDEYNQNFDSTNLKSSFQGDFKNARKKTTSFVIKTNSNKKFK